MKKSRLVLTVTAFVVVAVLVSVMRTGKGQETEPQKKAASERQQIVEALRRGDLREAARIKGAYVGDFNPYVWLKYDLEGLTQRSSAIVIGTPTENGSRLHSSGPWVETDYQLKIQRVLKGTVLQGSDIRVSLPGGRVVFEDGTSAETKTPNFERMKSGRTYLLFLREGENGEPVFTLTMWPQGLFEISDGERIKPNGRHQVDPVGRKYSGASRETFIRDVEAAVLKWPGVADCCD
jgi:hypothetical protein